jgi:ribosomal-protein-alanine N-acetyltransferase
MEVDLCPPSPADAEEFIGAVRASRSLHGPWLGPPDTPAMFAAYLERAGREDQASYLIRHRGCGALVGFVNVNNIVRGALQSGYGLHRVEANIQPGNVRSIGLVLRLGFEREGFSRRYLKVDGDWRDHERWALLAEDWPGTAGAPG